LSITIFDILFFI